MTLDGRTLLLADGRELRLAGIEAPDSAKPALSALADGREIRLFRLGPDTDRYGRVSALVVPERGDNRSIQAVLLEQGQARVAVRVGDKACAAEFLAAERRARSAGLGLWANPAYLIKRTENAREIAAGRGQLALVEGRVQSVRETSGTIYVNFSRNWAEDFTVTVQKRHERRFSAAGLDLKKLQGRRVRVRGTVEEWGGPWIEAMRPEQIELAGRD